MPRSTLIAVDTNVLIDCAAKDESVIDCLSTIKKRLNNPPILVLPTVIQELAHCADDGDSSRERDLALLAMRSLLHPWGFSPVNVIPVGHGIVQEIARKIRRQGLIPDEEVNDSSIVAEAALAGISILISSDHHLQEIDRDQLESILNACDVETPIIAHPKQIVNNFFRGAN
jgi:predicted nucleic acid-binding protein